MRKSKNINQVNVRIRKNRPNTGKRSERPRSNRKAIGKTKDSSDVLKSLVLKSKTKLAGEQYDNDRLIGINYNAVLKKLSTIVPNLEVKGDTSAEVLTNALLDFHKMALKKFKVSELDMCINTVLDGETNVEICFFAAYPNSDSMRSFAMDRLPKIEAAYPWLMPYIYTVIEHLINTNDVDGPDFKKGEESSVIEMYGENDFNKDELIEFGEYLGQVKSELAAIETKIYNNNYSIYKYKAWRELEMKIPLQIKKLLQVGEKILSNHDRIIDFVYLPDIDVSPVRPTSTNRFYHSMYDSDMIWCYMSEMIDNDANEYGALGFYKKIYFDHPGALFSPNDLPILLNKFLDGLWDLYWKIIKKKEGIV